MENKNIIIKVRGVIIYEDKLLIVKHKQSEFMALPGGHLEYGEDVITCLKRELVEELGVVPEVGRLLYISTFMDKKKINIPQKGAGRKWATRLKELGKQSPPKDLIDKINEDEKKKVAVSVDPKQDLDL